MSPRPSTAEPTPRRPSTLAGAWEVFRKDVRIERRTGEIVTTAGVFAIMVGFMAGAAFNPHGTPGSVQRAEIASATIWVTLFFAAMLSFARVWQREREESALTGLLVSPIPRASIFLGKALATFGMVLLVEVPLVALCNMLFNTTVFDHVGLVSAFLILGAIALAILGTLFGVLTVKTRARELILIICLFPLLSPVLLGGVIGLRETLAGSKSYEIWLQVLGGYDVVMLLMCVPLFGVLVDD